MYVRQQIEWCNQSLQGTFGRLNAGTVDLVKTRGIQRVIFMLHNYRVSWGCPNQTRTVYFGDWVHQFDLEDAQWRHEVAPLRALPRASVLPSLATIAPNPRELVPEVIDLTTDSMPSNLPADDDAAAAALAALLAAAAPAQRAVLEPALDLAELAAHPEDVVSRPCPHEYGEFHISRTAMLMTLPGVMLDDNVRNSGWLY